MLRRIPARRHNVATTSTAKLNSCRSLQRQGMCKFQHRRRWCKCYAGRRSIGGLGGSPIVHDAEESDPQRSHDSSCMPPIVREYNDSFCIVLFVQHVWLYSSPIMF